MLIGTPLVAFHRVLLCNIPAVDDPRIGARRDGGGGAVRRKNDTGSRGGMSGPRTTSSPEVPPVGASHHRSAPHLANDFRVNKHKDGGWALGALAHADQQTADVGAPPYKLFPLKNGLPWSHQVWVTPSMKCNVRKRWL